MTLRTTWLYLHVGEPKEGEGEETPEGHVLRFEPGTQRIVGLTVLGAQAILDRDGELRITIPESLTRRVPTTSRWHRGCLAPSAFDLRLETTALDKSHICRIVGARPLAMRRLLSLSSWSALCRQVEQRDGLLG